MSKVASMIERSYLRIYEFNEIAGNLNNVDEYSVDNQLSYIYEELAETISAFEKQDSIELLDGAVDIFVTSVGLLQKLEAAGFNVAEAMNRVDLNNLAKFPKNTDSIQYDASYIKTFNEKYGRYVLKDSSSKVRKYANFPKVDLSDCINKEFFKETT